MIVWIVIAVVIGLLVFMLLSPLDSLRWWRSQSGGLPYDFEVIEPDENTPPPADHYLVYLSGVGVIGGDALDDDEIYFLDELAKELPDIHIVADVFPYAVDNRGLLQRTTERVWAWLDRRRRVNAKAVLPYLISFRNVLQVLVSADPRYGPAQNLGLAKVIWRSLQEHGYRPGSGARVTMFGYSGGAQMSLGAGWYLSRLGVPVDMIGLGGVFGDDPGIQRMDAITQLVGEADTVHLLEYAFPGRWPTAMTSNWALAKRDGRAVQTTIGPMAHDGADGYFRRSAKEEDGESYSDATRDAVVKVLRERAER